MLTVKMLVSLVNQVRYSHYVHDIVLSFMPVLYLVLIIKSRHVTEINS